MNKRTTSYYGFSKLNEVILNYLYIYYIPITNKRTHFCEKSYKQIAIKV